VISDRQTLDNHFLSVFGSKHLRDIGPREIDAYKASKRHEKHQYGTGYSGKTINNHLAVLHRIFNKAIEYGTIDKNPVTKTSWLRPDRAAEDVRAWWTPDEEAKAMAMLVASWRARSPLKYLTLATQIVVGSGSVSCGRWRSAISTSRRRACGSAGPPRAPRSRRRRTAAPGSMSSRATSRRNCAGSC